MVTQKRLHTCYTRTYLKFQICDGCKCLTQIRVPDFITPKCAPISEIPCIINTMGGDMYVGLDCIKYGYSTNQYCGGRFDRNMQSGSRSGFYLIQIRIRHVCLFPHWSDPIPYFYRGPIRILTLLNWSKLYIGAK